jgi:hypothetical protein
MSIRKFSTASISAGTNKSTKLWDQETFQSGMFALATVSLTSTASSVVFSGISNNYTHLQIRVLARTDRTVDPRDYLGIRFNSDSTSSYTGHSLIGNGSSASAGGGGAGAEIQLGLASSAAQTASIFGSTIIDVLDYANTTKNKTIRFISGVDSNDTNGSVRFESSAWLKTDAITAISIEPGIGGNFVANSHFALYGIKAGS